jgi:hypothetical protein
MMDNPIRDRHQRTAHEGRKRPNERADQNETAATALDVSGITVDGECERRVDKERDNCDATV